MRSLFQLLRLPLLVAGIFSISTPASAVAPIFQLISPTAQTFVWGRGSGGDFAQFYGITTADITANLFVSSSDGCTAGSLGNLTGMIVLMERGTCSISDKSLNAADAGAVGALIFNSTDPGYAQEFSKAGPTAQIATFTTSDNVGQLLTSLARSGPVSLRMVLSEEDTDAPVVDAPNAVPEPATWMTMLVGFALTGCMLRKRKAGMASHSHQATPFLLA